MIFISYKCGEGKPLAERIAGHLESCGIPCFYCERDCERGDDANKYWDEVVVPVIKEKASAVILIMTSGILKKDPDRQINYVEQEVRLLEKYRPEIYLSRMAVFWDNESIDRDKPAVPGWADRLDGRQIIFTAIGLDKALDKLYARVGGWSGYEGSHYFTSEEGVLKKFNSGTSSLTIPGLYSEIGDAAFYGSEEIREVFLDKTNIKRIGQSAFKKCVNLTTVKLPPDIESVGLYAFKDALCAVTQNGLTIVSDIVLTDCRAGGNVILPDSVTCIADGAFWYNADIASVMGRNVRFIGRDAFKNCTNLTERIFPLLDEGELKK